jgi:uncharacterized membrane-anchored protein
MAIPFLQRSRFLRAFVLTIALFSFLLWFYVVLRVVVNGAFPPGAFVNRVPSLSFVTVGAVAFGVCFVSTLVYLWLWGWLDGRARGPRG